MAERSILITGCSSGIGQDAALSLHAKGWRVFATCRKEEDAAHHRARGLEAWRLDYTDEASVREGAERALDLTSGKLYAVFNNGAFALPALVEDLPRDGLREIYETNLFGPFELTARLIPAMRAQGTGRIVNCSSVFGFVAARARGAYIGTKYAMEGMTDTLRLELHGSGVHAVLIEPGPIRTLIRQNARAAFERHIDWENSASRGFYETTLRPRLYAENPPPDPAELPPSAVTARLIRALEARRPAARYTVTWPTALIGALRHVLPTRALDGLLRRI